MGTIQACASTPRLILTPLDREDTYSLQQLGNDPTVFRFVPDISTPFDAKAWVEEALSNLENYICHIIRMRNAQQTIGYIQINRRQNGKLQLGYWLGRDYWGKRYGQEAVASALLLFSGAGGGGYVFAAAYPENVASIKILNNLGFRKVERPDSSVARGMIDYVLRFGSKS